MHYFCINNKNSIHHNKRKIISSICSSNKNDYKNQFISTNPKISRIQREPKGRIQDGLSPQNKEVSIATVLNKPEFKENTILKNYNIEKNNEEEEAQELNVIRIMKN